MIELSYFSLFLLAIAVLYTKGEKQKKQLSVSSYEDLTVMGNEGWPACAPAFLLPSREWRIRTPFWKQHGRKSLFFPFSWQDVHINRTVF